MVREIITIVVAGTTMGFAHGVTVHAKKACVKAVGVMLENSTVQEGTKKAVEGVMKIWSK